MGRGVSSGGGQSSLGYLFGGSEAFKLLLMMLHQLKSPLLHPQSTKRFPLVSKAVKQKTAIWQMDRTVAILSLYDITGSTSFNFQYKWMR
ncbi:unnamed protein product [Musa acuminata var. zebrina]